METVATIIVIACLFGAWWLVAKNLKRRGKGFVIQHLLGATVGSVVTILVAVVFLATGILKEPDNTSTATSVAADLDNDQTLKVEETSKSTVAITEEYDLDLTPTDFIANFNIALKITGMNMQLPLDVVIDKGEVNNTYRGGINENLQIVAIISKESENTKSVTLIGTGDGTVKSGTDIMLSGIALFMAASDQAYDEGKNLNADLFVELLKQATDTGDSAAKVVGKHKYSITPMDSLGTWITVEAVG